MRYRSVSVAGMLVVILLLSAIPAAADVTDMSAGHWSAGAAMGFLGNTPDRAADFALKANLDYFLSRYFAVGPMLQYGGGGSQVIFGLTAMAKYFWAVPNNERLKIVS